MSVTAGIVSSRAKAGSWNWNVHRLLAPWFHFLASYDSSKNSQGVTPSEGDFWYELAILAIFRPISLRISEQVQIRPKLPLNTNRKLHKRFQLVPKSVTLDDLKLTLNGHYALFHITHHVSFGAHIPQNMNKDRPIPSAAISGKNVNQGSMFLARYGLCGYLRGFAAGDANESGGRFFQRFSTDMSPYFENGAFNTKLL